MAMAAAVRRALDEMQETLADFAGALDAAVSMAKHESSAHVADSSAMTAFVSSRVNLRLHHFASN